MLDSIMKEHVRLGAADIEDEKASTKMKNAQRDTNIMLE
jgi:hypothetical protein